MRRGFRYKLDRVVVHVLPPIPGQQLQLRQADSHDQECWGPRPNRGTYRACINPFGFYTYLVTRVYLSNLGKILKLASNRTSLCHPSIYHGLTKGSGFYWCIVLASDTQLNSHVRKKEAGLILYAIVVLCMRLMDQQESPQESPCKRDHFK
ncbi:hypothetical protein VNO77_27296 [Canavalia gladiata]|uniref:Uncharacterized protein n=1 Tax=Canavalia gladiata TaxID=3824 RepID=A0AAN9KUF5_CANGL